MQDCFTEKLPFLSLGIVFVLDLVKFLSKEGIRQAVLNSGSHVEEEDGRSQHPG